MKALILTVTAGAGHNMVAREIEKKFSENGFETQTLDIFSDQKFISFMVEDVGFAMMHMLPAISRKVYADCVKTNITPFNGFVKATKKAIVKKINAFAPDVIVSTHVAGNLVAHWFKKEISKPFVSYFIMTDYSITPSLEMPSQNEFIVAPSEDFKQKLEQKGFSKDQILPFGIPIDEKYYRQLNKAETVEKLGLSDFDTNKKTVLLMGGGKGLGKIFKTVKKLKNLSEIQIITICGNNKRLKSKIDKLAKKYSPNQQTQSSEVVSSSTNHQTESSEVNSHTQGERIAINSTNQQLKKAGAGKKAKPSAKIYNYGFCKNVDEFMSVADFIFGKAGGITATEALAKNLTVICIKDIPNPEYENLNYLCQKNCAKKFDSLKDFVQFLSEEAMENTPRLNPSIPHSAQRLLEFHQKLIKG